MKRYKKEFKEGSTSTYPYNQRDLLRTRVQVISDEINEMVINGDEYDFNDSYQSEKNQAIEAINKMVVGFEKEWVKIKKRSDLYDKTGY